MPPRAKTATLTPEAELAVTASIAKWERNCAAETLDQIKTGPDDCPLCALYRNMGEDKANHCKDCPVAISTGQPYCEDTPYEKVFGTYLDACYVAEPIETVPVSGNLRRLMLEELAFLKSLPPTDSGR